MGRFTQLAFFPLLALAALVPAAAFGKVCRHSLCRSKPAVVTYAYDHRGRMVRKEVSHRDTEPQRSRFDSKWYGMCYKFVDDTISECQQKAKR